MHINLPKPLFIPRHVSFFLKKNYLCVWNIYVHMCTTCITVRSPRTDVMIGWEPPCAWWELNPGPLQDKHVFLATEPSLQPQHVSIHSERLGWGDGFVKEWGWEFRSPDFTQKSFRHRSRDWKGIPRTLRGQTRWQGNSVQPRHPASVNKVGSNQEWNQCQLWASAHTCTGTHICIHTVNMRTYTLTHTRMKCYSNGGI